MVTTSSSSPANNAWTKLVIPTLVMQKTYLSLPIISLVQLFSMRVSTQLISTVLLALFLAYCSVLKYEIFTWMQRACVCLTWMQRAFTVCLAFFICKVHVRSFSWLFECLLVLILFYLILLFWLLLQAALVTYAVLLLLWFSFVFHVLSRSKK
jgi:hypothetical protein